MTKARSILRVTFAVALLIASAVSDAQPVRKVPLVALLMTGAPSDGEPMTAAFRQQLRDLGYVEGQNINFDFRWAHLPQYLPDLVTDFVKNKVDVLVVQGTPAAQAAKRATNTIPIVMATSGDPVAVGLVASLARPGGNVTGNSILGPELSGKRLELLKEIIPGLSRIAVLSNPTNPTHAFTVRATVDAAKILGVSVQLLEAQAPEDFEPVFQAATRERAGALVVFGDPVFTANRTRLATIATKNKLPALYELSGFVEAGGLSTYGPTLPEMFRRAAVYVDKIIKGANPADLPVEQPTKFELVINITTAKALGLTIPQTVLLRADRVVQ